MSLVQSIKIGASILQPEIPWADPLRILCAIAQVESRFGTWNVPRFEKAFAFHGIYFNKEQEERYSKWGAMACCSWGSFQILYTSACELGFDKSPWNRNPMDLWDDEIGVLFVCEYIKKRILANGVTDLSALADAWNSGSAYDHNVPGEYIQMFLSAYVRGRPELELVDTA